MLDFQLRVCLLKCSILNPVKRTDSAHTLQQMSEQVCSVMYKKEIPGVMSRTRVWRDVQHIFSGSKTKGQHNARNLESRRKTQPLLAALTLLNITCTLV